MFHVFESYIKEEVVSFLYAIKPDFWRIKTREDPFSDACVTIYVLEYGFSN